MADIKDVQILLELGKQYNLEYLSIGDVSITFRAPEKQSALADVIDRQMLAEAIGESEGRPTEDEFLFMSSPLGSPNLRTEPIPEDPMLDDNGLKIDGN
jgi:hypothetical protein